MNSSLPVSPAVAPAPHAFTVHDMLAMQRISEPRVSPDGKRMVFTVRTTDMEEDIGWLDQWLKTDDRRTPQGLK
jgi:dipeptidyl aminopeptidase/acylaminoacyl peptidase